MGNKIALSIIGSSRANGDREENDFYPTPPEAIQAIIKKENLTNQSVWEPACGDGAIAFEVLKTNPKLLFCSDIIDRGFSSETCGKEYDFLNLHHSDFDVIITNPPYILANEFVKHAKKLSKKKIIFLLKLNFLAGAKRNLEIFSDQTFPLSKVYVFKKRLSFYKNGQKMKNTGMIDFAWFVWDRERNRINPEIHWL
jgi:hypothetical protein